MENITIGEIIAVIVICQTLMTFAEKIFDKITKPHKDLANSESEIKKELVEQKSRIDNIESQLQQVTADIRILIKINLDMMEHMVTGNHQAAMKQTIKELQNYLVEKSL